MQTSAITGVLTMQDVFVCRRAVLLYRDGVVWESIGECSYPGYLPEEPSFIDDFDAWWEWLLKYKVGVK